MLVSVLREDVGVVSGMSLGLTALSPRAMRSMLADAVSSSKRACYVSCII